MQLSYTQEQLIEAVGKSKNIGQVVFHLSGAKSGSRYNSVRTCIKLWNVDTSHFDPMDRHNIQKMKVTTPLDEILVENYQGGIKNQIIKKRLIQNNLMEDKCNICGIPPLWNGMELVLQLDHINGINNDNRLSNLRITCPNCHTQTKTWGNKKRKNVPID